MSENQATKQSVFFLFQVRANRRAWPREVHTLLLRYTKPILRKKKPNSVLQSRERSIGKLGYSSHLRAGSLVTCLCHLCCLVPRRLSLSLDENVRASPLQFITSRSSVPCEKRSAWGGGCHLCEFRQFKENFVGGAASVRRSDSLTSSRFYSLSNWGSKRDSK